MKNKLLNIRIIHILIISLIAICPVSTYAINQDFSEKDITEFEEKILKLQTKYEVPGLAVGLIKNGKTMYTKSFGYKNLLSQEKLENSTIFQAASISKSVTAIGIMKLVENEIIYPELGINEYLINWKLSDSLFDANMVNVNNLLNHSAGINVGGFKGFPPNTQTKNLIMALNGSNSSNNTKVGLIKPPNLEFDYSGGGYMILSFLMEELTPNSFENYMNCNVLNPIGMLNSTYLWNKSLKRNIVTPYDKKSKELPLYVFSSKGASSLYTNIIDMSKFTEQLFLLPQDNPLLKQQTLLSMYKNLVPIKGGLSLFFDQMGSGFMKDNTGLYAHTGSNKGFRNILAFYPESGDGIVILTNSDNGRNLYVEILDIWTKSLNRKAPKMCRFFKRLYLITKLLGLSLIISSLIILFNLYKSIKIKKRIFVLYKKNKASQFFKIGIILAGIIIFSYFFALKILPILSDLSPLTSHFVFLTILFLILSLFLKLVFPTKS